MPQLPSVLESRRCKRDVHSTLKHLEDNVNPSYQESAKCNCNQEVYRGQDGELYNVADCLPHRHARTHSERMADPEYALTRVTDYLTGEVARAMRGLDPAVGPQRNRRQRIYDATDAAVIIMARRADMALERQRKAEAK